MIHRIPLRSQPQIHASVRFQLALTGTTRWPQMRVRVATSPLFYEFELAHAPGPVKVSDSECLDHCLHHQGLVEAWWRLNGPKLWDVNAKPLKHPYTCGHDEQ